MRISDRSSDVCSSDLERAGYKLVWRDTPNAYDKARMASSKGYDLTHSLGLSIDKDGVAGSILWNGPAFRADIVNGTKIVAVYGVAYRKDRTSVVKGKSGTVRLDLGGSRIIKKKKIK